MHAKARTYVIRIRYPAVSSAVSKSPHKESSVDRRTDGQIDPACSTRSAEGEEISYYLDG